MPLLLRTVTPLHVARSTLPPQFPVQNDLEAVANGTLSNIIRQLSSLSHHAEELFLDLIKVGSEIATRAQNLQARIDRLAVRVGGIDMGGEEATMQESLHTKPFSSSLNFNQQVVSRSSLPAAMEVRFLLCDPPPPLDKLNSYRDDGKDGLKFYTDPSYFFDLWRQEMLKDTEQRVIDKSRKALETEPHKLRQDGGAGGRHGNKKRVRQPPNTRERQRHLALEQGEVLMMQNTPSPVLDGSGSLPGRQYNNYSNENGGGQPPIDYRFNSMTTPQQQQQQQQFAERSYSSSEYNDSGGYRYEASSSAYRHSNSSSSNKSTTNGYRPSQPPPAPPPAAANQQQYLYSPTNGIQQQTPPQQQQSRRTPPSSNPPPGILKITRTTLPPPPPLPQQQQQQHEFNQEELLPPPFMDDDEGDLPLPPPPEAPEESYVPPPPPPPQQQQIIMGSYGNGMPTSNMLSNQRTNLKPPPPAAASNNVVRDGRSELLKAIRDGIEFRKVETHTLRSSTDDKVSSAYHDVASILARRVAVEMSDSETDSDGEGGGGGGDEEEWDETSA